MYSRETGHSLIDRYFASDGDGAQLVKHQTHSFNDFVSSKLDCVINGMNPIEVGDTYCTSMRQFKSVLSISFTSPCLALPMICEKDGMSKVMYPNDARMRNMTYSSSLTVDANVEVRTWNDDVGEYIVNSKRVTGVSLGRIPLMVRSRYCMLSKQTTPAPYDECRYDYGGYFVVNGNEKVVISQDRISENRTYVFTNTTKTSSCYSHTAEVRSVNHAKFIAPKTTLLKLSKKSDQFGVCIRANVHHVRAEVPVFVLFRALGVLTDKDIVRFIVRDEEDADFERIANSLAGCIDEATEVRTQKQAWDFLAQFVQSSYNNYNSSKPNRAGNGTSEVVNDASVSGGGSSSEGLRDASVNGGGCSSVPVVVPVVPTQVPREGYQHSFIQSILTKDVLPHVGTCFNRKALYLGYMVNKLLRCSMGLLPQDDRDSYVNKRLDTPGVLLANLFRQYYCKMVKELRSSLQSLMKGNYRATRVINTITRPYLLKVVKGSIIESGLKYALSTGNWGIKTTRVRQGVAQVLNRLTFIATLSHLRRVNTAIEKTGKLVMPRKLHPTQWGMACPSETPEGTSVGLVKNLALLANVTIFVPPGIVLESLLSLGMLPFDSSSLPEQLFEGGAAMVMLNGDIVGAHSTPNVLFCALKRMKRTGLLGMQTSVCWHNSRNEIVLCTEGGRFCRPMLVVDLDTQLLLPEVFDPGASWQDLVVCGAIEYLDVEESDGAMIALYPAKDLQPGVSRFTHAEIDPSSILGVVAGSIPFSDHNQAPRNTYQSAMGKQAVGVFATTFRHRLDTMSLFLNYPQEPLVSTHTAKLVNCDKLPCGINTIVAIACFTGFNQEDSVIMSRSAVDRGFFSTTLYRTFREQNTKNHSTGEEEFFCRPNSLTTRNMKPYNYDLLDESGFVPEGTSVEAGDVIIGKCMPQKQGGVFVNKDASVALRSNESGVIDRNCHGDRFFTNTTGDGYTFAKVRLRTDRVPTVGDKVSSRHGQKGTIGMLYSEEDMPFTENGIVPSIIMNPHAIPSRMTIGQLMEALESKVCGLAGRRHGDASPFNGRTVEDIADELEALGMRRYGDEIMYNPRTGERISTPIFVCPTYYQRLKHMVADKIHCLTSDHEVLTSEGWVHIRKLRLEHKLASLRLGDGQIEYCAPEELYGYPTYNGPLYHVTSPTTDIVVTPEHRLCVQSVGTVGQSSTELISCSQLVSHGYLSRCESPMKHVQRGTWVGSDLEEICCDDDIFHEASEFILHNEPIRKEFLFRYSTGTCRRLLMLVFSGTLEIEMSSQEKVDSLMHLALHAGEIVVVDPCGISGFVARLVMSSMSTSSNVSFETPQPLSVGAPDKCDFIAEGSIVGSNGVYCVRMPRNETFFVRRNGRAVWTGNSRAANGPVVLLTRQPAEGRARDGGLRLGEMEMECLWAHGTMGFLKERFMECSDNYRVFVCKCCGMMAHANPESNLFYCKSCKNLTEFNELRIPYASKLLVQEVETMAIATRFVTDA